MRILITGASGGLGTAVVQQFLSENHTVIAVARSWPKPPPRVITISADLTNVSDCARMAQEAGEVDTVVHVMGGFAGGKPVGETDPDVFDRMIAINLKSAFLVFRAITPQLIARGRGRLIAVGSRVGVEAVAGLSAYGVSKAGLVHLVRTLALELKGTGVTSNIVLPSTIDTAANHSAMPGADATKWVSPESIARVVSWLASDAAADVNGAVIPVYGDA